MTLDPSVTDPDGEITGGQKELANPWMGTIAVTVNVPIYRDEQCKDLVAAMEMAKGYISILYDAEIVSAEEV